MKEALAVDGCEIGIKRGARKECWGKELRCDWDRCGTDVSGHQTGGTANPGEALMGENIRGL